jgi:hypothetical protein
MLAATPADAQTPDTYNSARAYHHFLMSSSSYRTLYSSVPGSGYAIYSPWGYQSQFVQPGYIQQRLTPFGYERFDAVPSSGGMIVTPFGFQSYYYPGFGVGYFVPWGMPPGGQP